MVQVKSPYNFVPLNKEVFFPPWGPYVSHDIPFKNGLSGKLELTITAESPIFIRGKEEVNRLNPDYKEYHFPQTEDGRYYIPGSSIKGMLSGVLEILSFGKLRFYNNDKHSQRDWENDKLYPKADFATNKCGWLYKKEGGIYLQRAGGITRVAHENIGSGFKDLFSVGFDALENECKENNKPPDFHKTAKIKYQKYREPLNVLSYGKPIRDAERGFEHYEIDDKDPNQTNKTLVFTGQSSKRDYNQKKGKRLEFLFNKYQKHVNGDIILSEGKNEMVYIDFCSTYKNSIDWNDYWKPKFEKGEPVPVFYAVDENNNKQIKHMGLSMLYRLPYKYNIKSLVDSTQKHHTNKLDLPECLFGHIGDENKSKHRVTIGHAFINDPENISSKPVTKLLGSPKSSYYPFYLEQKSPSNDPLKVEKGIYKTFENDDAKIAGRKRYAVKKQYDDSSEEPSKVSTTFHPLYPDKEKGLSFSCQLNYHNLLPEELGALLSAITFHETAGCRHQLGMAKAFGFGVVRVDISHDSIDLVQRKSYEGLFEKLMEKQWRGGWLNHEILKELIALSTPVEDNDIIKAYLKLDTEGINEFAELKKENGMLPRYSVFMRMESVGMKSVSSASSKVATNVFSYDSSKYDERLREYREKVKQVEQEVNAKILAKEAQIRAENDLKKELEANEKKVNIQAAKRQKAIEEDFPAILDANKTFRKFDDFKKKMDRILKNYHGQNSNSAEKDDMDSTIPEEFISKTIIKVKFIIESRSDYMKNNQAILKNCQKPLIRWFGEDTCKKIFEELNIL